MGGRESLAQAFTLLSFVSAGLIGVTSLPVWEPSEDTEVSPPKAVTSPPEPVMAMRSSILNLPVTDGIQSSLTASEIASDTATDTAVDGADGLNPDKTRPIDSAVDSEPGALVSEDDRVTNALSEDYVRTDAVLDSLSDAVSGASPEERQTIRPRPTAVPPSSVTATRSPSGTSFLPRSDVQTVPPADRLSRGDRATIPRRTLEASTPEQRQNSPSQADLATASALNQEIVVDLSDRQVALYRNNQLQMIFPIAVGRVGWETPVGEFEVIEKRVNPTWQNPLTNEIVEPGPSNPLGVRWISFWSDGKNQLGFHGTNQTELIGQAVSHGCIRMRNQDIERLYDQIAMGTPVLIQE